MFTIKIAGIPLAIANNYRLAEMVCKPFFTSEAPFFTVSVTREDILQEEGTLSADAELLCIHRKIALSMLTYDAFLMHAAVIDMDGDGVAFTAASGIGKTTRVYLWQKAFANKVRVVNGDKPILRFIDDTLYAFGTPWMGKENLGENICVPLKYVCFLERSEDVSLTKLLPEQILPRLFKQIILPKEKEQLRYFMEMIERFVLNVSFFLLRCNQDKEDPVRIWDLMKNEK